MSAIVVFREIVTSDELRQCACRDESSRNHREAQGWEISPNLPQVAEVYMCSMCGPVDGLVPAKSPRIRGNVRDRVREKP